jgi:hypothetical protein
MERSGFIIPEFKNFFNKPESSSLPEQGFLLLMLIKKYAESHLRFICHSFTSD